MPIEMENNHLKQPPPNEYKGKVGVCILAAGLAKRLEPISKVIAKPAFPLGGKTPILELWIRKFITMGITKIAMNLHRVPESISSYFDNGGRFLADISYVMEKSPSGTLGGVIKMVKKFHEEGFYPERIFIPSGDIVSGVKVEDLNKMYDNHIKNGAALTMMLAPIPWDRRSDFGTAVLEGAVCGKDIPAGTYAFIRDFVEKDPDSPSNENNASNYLIETDFLMGLEPYLTEADPNIKNPCYDFGKHVLMGMKGKIPYLRFLTERQGGLYGYDPGSLWFDVGNKKDYLEVNKAVLQGKIPVNMPYTMYPWGWMGDNVDIDFTKVTIKPPVVIGSYAVIGNGSEIGPNAVIGDNWKIDKNAKITNSILWSHYNYKRELSGLTSNTNELRRVREGVTIETSIVVGGIINSNIKEMTVNNLPDGKLDIMSIHWVPEGPRA